MSERVPDRVLQNILVELDEMDRLKTLGNKALVEEWLVCGSDLAVEEMASRLSPGWEERPIGH